jgi:predicted nucleotidyltransferase
MKRTTAIQTIREITHKLFECNGLIETPGCSSAHYKIQELWLFGSTAKGSQTPNDIDLLYIGDSVGPYRRVGTDPSIELDKDYLRRYGIARTKPSNIAAFHLLIGKKKMVRMHSFEVEEDLAHPRILLFPTCELDEIKDEFTNRAIEPKEA